MGGHILRQRISCLVAAAAISALSGLPTGAQTQDIVGFDRSDFGKVVLAHRQAAINFEAAIQGYNNEPISTYSTTSAFARLGKSVGRLDVLTDSGVFPCTAFVVSDRYILTNHHCVPGIVDNPATGATRIEAVSLLLGYTEQGVVETAQRFTVSPVPLETDRELDFSVLEVFGDPTSKFGKLNLAARPAEDGDPFWVIGHPHGEAQRISREQCRASRPALSGGKLRHTCDTLPGNSGSPVIDASRQQVIGLHHAGSERDAVNFAIPMATILGRSKLLKAALEPGANRKDPTPVVDACDAFYDEARKINACYAYRAYLDACSTHMFGNLAKGYLDENCSPPDPAPDPEPIVLPPPPPAPHIPELVRLQSGVHVGQSPVTVAQFRAFVEATGYVAGRGCRVHIRNWSNMPDATWDYPWYTATPDHPVTCVSYNNASAYARWLTRETGEEYAVMPHSIWLEMISGFDPYKYAVCQNCRNTSHQPRPVGSVGPTPGNIADGLGNVWQWMGNCSGTFCSMRGGAWDTPTGMLRTQVFTRDRSSFRTNALGFRVVRYP